MNTGVWLTRNGPRGYLFMQDGSRRKDRNNAMANTNVENYDYAVRLATVLQQHFYADNDDWRPLGTLNGVLSQIDNMIAGLIDKAKPARTFKIQEPNGPF